MELTEHLKEQLTEEQQSLVLAWAQELEDKASRLEQQLAQRAEQERNRILERAVKKELTAHGARSPELVMTFILDWDTIGLEDGKLTGLAEQIHQMESGPETAFLFQKTAEGQKPRFLPVGRKGGDLGQDKYARKVMGLSR